METPEPNNPLLELLEKLRTEGKRLFMRDLEPLLPAYGVRVGSREHFILMMADFEMAQDMGDSITVEDLVEDHPHWRHRIYRHLLFLEGLKGLAPAGGFRAL